MSEEFPEAAERMARSIAIRSHAAEAIAPADRVEAHLLDPVQEPGALGWFPLHP
jgi:hypothetical protein